MIKGGQGVTQGLFPGRHIDRRLRKCMRYASPAVDLACNNSCGLAITVWHSRDYAPHAPAKHPDKISSYLETNTYIILWPCRWQSSSQSGADLTRLRAIDMSRNTCSSFLPITVRHWFLSLLARAHSTVNFRVAVRFNYFKFLMVHKIHVKRVSRYNLRIIETFNEKRKTKRELFKRWKYSWSHACG